MDKSKQYMQEFAKKCIFKIKLKLGSSGRCCLSVCVRAKYVFKLISLANYGKIISHLYLEKGAFPSFTGSFDRWYSSGILFQHKNPNDHLQWNYFTDSAFCIRFFNRGKKICLEMDTWNYNFTFSCSFRFIHFLAKRYPEPSKLVWEFL